MLSAYVRHVGAVAGSGAAAAAVPICVKMLGSKLSQPGVGWQSTPRMPSPAIAGGIWPEVSPM